MSSKLRITNLIPRNKGKSWEPIFEAEIRKVREYVKVNYWRRQKTGISSNYLSMVEISRKFPTPEMLDRLAGALNIQTFQLFDPAATPDGALLHLEQAIIENIEIFLRKSIKQDILSEIKLTISEAMKQALSEENKAKKKK